MRYIGNKTKLLDFIGAVVDEKRIGAGIAFDAFSGTASVGRYLKRRGFDVLSCDLMTYSFVFQRALIEMDEIPRFDEVFRRDAELRELRESHAFKTYVDSRFGLQGDLFSRDEPDYRRYQEIVCYLERFAANVPGLISEEYAAKSQNSGDGRMFFTMSNAERIDSMRAKLESWHRSGALNDSEYYAILASLIEAADAVANTTGVYAAFVKTWQSNSQRRIALAIPGFVVNTGRNCRAIQGNVNEVVAELPALDLLYLDPPYNTRQYSSYYHVPELIARGWFNEVPKLRGKTGLIENAHQKSAWSTVGGCVDALDDLLSKATFRYLLMSYNSEGIIPESEVRRLFKSYGRAETFQVFERDYERYRSDGDSELRQYKADTVTEKVYYVER